MIRYRRLSSAPWALDDLNKALEVPGDVDETLVLVTRAGIHRRLGKGRAALRDLNRALDRNLIRRADILFVRAAAFAAWGQSRVAAIDLEQSAKEGRSLNIPDSDPDAAILKPIMAEAAHHGEDLAKKAEASMSAAGSGLARLEPFDIELSSAAGIPPSAKVELAREFLARAGTVDKWCKSSHVEQYGCDEAQWDIGRAVALVPGLVEAYVLSARILADDYRSEANEKREKILAQVKAALAIDPSNSDALALRQAWAKKGR